MIFIFALVIASTKLALIPGLSAAGADSSALRYTASADADLMRYGAPVRSDIVPVDPQGHPTPAVITKAALDLAHEPRCVADAGSFFPPAAPYASLGEDPGEDPTARTAVPRAKEIMRAAEEWSRRMFAREESLTIAESVPGGTTTALLILRALGYEGMVSSAGLVNPIALKEDIWSRASARIGITRGGLRGRAVDAVRELGDPMQAAVAGIARGLPPREVILAGGTQMLAVAALLREIAPHVRPIVATTKYVARDENGSFAEIASEIGVETYVAPLDFSRSRHKGLAELELGFIKEGVGAGGAVRIAERAGASAEEVRLRAEIVYDGIISRCGYRGADGEDGQLSDD